MNLSDLLGTPSNVNYSNVEINRIDTDSRQVEHGSLFIAYKGLSTDGHFYLKEAEENGAVAAIVSYQVPDVSIPQIIVPDPRTLLAPLSSKLYQTSSEDIRYYAVTGTDGKTTTSHMLMHILQKAKQAVACIGTVGVFASDHKYSRTYLTTPQAPELHSMIRKLMNDGIDNIILETSSHALDQGRVDGIDFKYAIFTNFTAEHLDYHKSMQDYLEAKLKLFRRLNENSTAILNADDQSVMRAATSCTAKIITYGISSEAMYQAFDIEEESCSINFQLRFQGVDYTVRIPCLGRFNVYNALAAICAAHQSGLDLVAIIKSMTSFRSVGGRQEAVDLGQRYMVISDFAHTENAILSMLKWAHSIPHNKIRVLATAAANRDRSKRPRIGHILDQYCDHIYLTSGIVDYENPYAILQEILIGIKNHDVTIIINRLEAIEKIIDAAEDNDIILILGIGNYNDLPIAGRRIYYNEVDAIRLAIARRQMNDALLDIK